MVPLALQQGRDFTARVAAVMEGKDHGGDYIVYWAAGKLYRANRDGGAYDAEQMRTMEFTLHPPLAADPVWQAQRGQVLRQPPVVLPAMDRLGAIHPAIGFMLCTLVEAFLLGALLAATGRWAATRAGPAGAVAWVALALGWTPTWQPFHSAQWSAAVGAVAFLAGLALLRRGDTLEAGLCWAGLALKGPFYLLPLALFLGLTRHRRALTGLVLGGAALTVLSVHFAGLGGLQAYLKSQADAPRGLYFAGYDLMFNWRGLWERWLAPWTGLIGPAELVCATATWTAACLAWWRPAEGERRELQFYILALALVLAGPAHAYDLLILLPALALAARSHWDSPGFVVTCVVFCLLSPLPVCRDATVLVLAALFGFLVRRSLR